MERELDFPQPPGTERAPRPAPDRAPQLAAVPEGLYLFGVARARNLRGAKVERDEPVRIRYRDLEALVRPVPYRIPELDEARVQDHQTQVETAMRRGTILPAPFGLVFRGRRAVIRFLEDQYIALDEGLAFLDGHWELRLHVSAAVEETEAVSDLAVHLYSELRRSARAAIPLPTTSGRLLSAAFLVERKSWIEFVERSGDLDVAHPELSFDVTGPWPPYDFVRFLG